MKRITPFLGYANEAEQAAAFCASIFPSSSVERVTAMPGESPSGPLASVKVVDFALFGQRFTVPDHDPARNARLTWPRSACDEVYRIYNAGRSAPRGPGLERATLLRAEAVRLGRRLVQREPKPEAFGLLALMLLHESRGSSSVDPVADLAMLERQDRSSWSREHIIEARGLIDRALGSPHVGSYVLRAAIAAVHAEAATFAATDWARIVALHEFLARADASTAVASSRAPAQEKA